MRRLNKYKLDSKLSLSYLKKNLNQTNELSSQMLEVLCSNSGEFYVLLPADSDSKRIHNFNEGYITASIDEEICRYVVNRIKNKELSCIFDDVNTTWSDHFKDEFSLAHSLFYKNEVYYVIKKKMLSEDIFLKCMAASDAIWHSLCVITFFDLDAVSDKKLNQNMIKKICVNACFTMIGAYDGESYIFWEKTR